MPAECPPASTDAALRALQTQHADLLARLSVLYSVLVHCSREQEKLGSESFQSKALWGLCHCCVFLFGDTSSGTGTGDTSRRSSPGRTTRPRPERSFTLPRCSRWSPAAREGPCPRAGLPPTGLVSTRSPFPPMRRCPSHARRAPRPGQRPESGTHVDPGDITATGWPWGQRHHQREKQPQSRRQAEPGALRAQRTSLWGREGSRLPSLQ